MCGGLPAAHADSPPLEARLPAVHATHRRWPVITSARSATGEKRFFPIERNRLDTPPLAPTHLRSKRNGGRVRTTSVNAFKRSLFPEPRRFLKKRQFRWRGSYNGRTRNSAAIGHHPAASHPSFRLRPTAVPSPPRGEPPSTQLPPTCKHIGGAIITTLLSRAAASELVSASSECCSAGAER